MPHSSVNPSTVFRSLDHGFSQGVVATGRRTLYVSGQTAWTADRTIAGLDRASQARQAFANVRVVVEAAGATLADVVMVRIYVVGYQPEHADAIGAAFRETFADAAAPACSWIGVAALADPDFLIEVEAVAVFD